MFGKFVSKVVVDLIAVAVALIDVWCAI